MPNNYMYDPFVNMYYVQWAKSTTVFSGHALDDERFYKFVKACIGYAKTRHIDCQKLDTELLRSNLYDAFSLGIDKSRYEIINKFISRFSDIIWYEATKFD
jgi:hypothetical protein